MVAFVPKEQRATAKFAPGTTRERMRQRRMPVLTQRGRVRLDAAIPIPVVRALVVVSHAGHRPSRGEPLG
jgi:hypothetical protein